LQGAGAAAQAAAASLLSHLEENATRREPKCDGAMISVLSSPQASLVIFVAISLLQAVVFMVAPEVRARSAAAPAS
jgi:hypothetical protein